MIFLKKKTVNSISIDKTFFALGTVNNIKIFDNKNNDTIKMTVSRVSEINYIMSAYKDDSDICKLKQNAGRDFIEIHEDTFRLIKKAVEFSSMSDGAFDITIRPLVELWGINKKGNYVPADSEIQEMLNLVDYHDILLNEETFSILLKKPGQAIDLGGIAKGFAADEVKRILTENGIKSALINLGGNVITIGRRPDGKPWQIGIQNPLAPTGQHLGILSVVNKTIVTSGSNERFFIKDGIRYHHILNPQNGKPVQNGLLSVTAVCSSSTDADALTTALFILGPKKSEFLLKEFHAEAIFVTEDLSVIVSNGLKYNYINSN